MSTEFPSMSVEETTHILAFIAAFVGKPKRGRWWTILAMKSEKWLGVSASDCTKEPAADWNARVDDTLAKHNLTSELDRKAYEYPTRRGWQPPLASLISMISRNFNFNPAFVGGIPVHKRISPCPRKKIRRINPQF